MGIQRFRRHWRWLLTVLLLLLVGIIWFVVIPIPSRPTGHLLIELQQNDQELFYTFNFTSQNLSVIPRQSSSPIEGYRGYQTSLSADGTRIAFTSTNRNQYRISVTDNTFSADRIVTSGPRDFSPALSPDGNNIIFERISGNFSALFSADVTSGSERQLTQFTNDIEADWAPDGKRIVFTTSRDGFQELYTMAADGSDQIRLTNNEKLNDLSAQYSPDGKCIAYVTNYSVGDGSAEIWLMDANGERQQRLTNDHLDDREPTWSSDSNLIAFTHTQQNGHGTDVYIYNVSTGQIRQLTNTSGYEYQPTWSPDSNWIAFSSNPTGDGQQIFIEIIRANGTDRQSLVFGTKPIPTGYGFHWLK
jgi:TolB protein